MGCISSKSPVAQPIPVGVVVGEPQKIFEPIAEPVEIIKREESLEEFDPRAVLKEIERNKSLAKSCMDTEAKLASIKLLEALKRSTNGVGTVQVPFWHNGKEEIRWSGKDYERVTALVEARSIPGARYVVNVHEVGNLVSWATLRVESTEIQLS